MTTSDVVSYQIILVTAQFFSVSGTGAEYCDQRICLLLRPR